MESVKIRGTDWRVTGRMTVLQLIGTTGTGWPYCIHSKT